MTEERWLEPKSKIPFVGIVAIVLIVAVVAIFIKTQLGPFFPASTVEVTEGTAANTITGKASSSFIGLREIDLTQKELLSGVLNIRDRNIRFTIDVASQIMTIRDNGVTEEVMLDLKGDALSSTFEHNNQKTYVKIELSKRNLFYNEVDKMGVPVNIVLADITTYTGRFQYKNQNYLFTYQPLADEATISGITTSTITLTQENNIYVGAWQDGTSIKPITVDILKHKATIEDVY